MVIDNFLLVLIISAVIGGVVGYCACWFIQVRGKDDDVKGMVSGPSDSEQAEKDYSRSKPIPKGDPDFTRAVLQKNEDFPGLTPQDVGKMWGGAFHSLKVDEEERIKKLDLVAAGPDIEEVRKLIENSWSQPFPTSKKSSTSGEIGLCDNRPGDVTPSQVNIYTSNDIHFGLTKNKIDEHYRKRNTVRRKGKGLIRPSRTSQRDYQSRH